MPEELPQTPQTETVVAVNGAPKSMLDRILLDGKLARDEQQKALAKDLVGEFVGQVLDEGMQVGADTVASIKTRIAQIDALIGAQLNAILHHPDVQSLEAAWRGLHYLVSNTETGASMKIRLLNVKKQELATDLERATEFDQSTLFKKIYEEEYGTYGGNPYSLLIGDYEWGRSQQDIATLEKISNVAAAAHAPFVSAASAKLFDWDSFTEMMGPRDLSKGFEASELTKWQSFRASEDSRYVALVLPHILMRPTYGPDKPVDGLDFVEDVDGKDHSKYLWGNAAYALGARITDAFAKHRWTAAIRGVEGGGLVEGLPTHTFRTDDGDKAMKCPTEIAITDRREKELNDLGFIALCHCKGKDYAAFFGGQTTNKPKLYNTNDANANARISAMLPYILASSRFAHYLKVIMRDKIGSFASRDNVQTFLNTWISDYILLDDTAPQAVKANFPLRDGRVEVTEVAGKPGAYKAVVYLKPHFQLEELTVSLRLVADLPAAAA